MELIKHFQILFQIIYGIPLLLFYILEKYIPRNKNLWIFSSWFGEQYSDSSRALYEYVSNTNHEIRCVWLLKNKELIRELRKKGIKAYYSDSLFAFFYLIQSGIIFSTTGAEFSLFFINGAKFYELWHGMPLKKILLDDDSVIGPKNSKLGRIGHIRNIIFKWRHFLDYEKLYTVTNSDFFITYLKTAFSLPEDKIIKSGLPRCDKMFNSSTESIIKEIKILYPNSKIILYMPTHRTSSWTGESFNPFSENYEFNKEKLLKILDMTNSVLIYKPHFYDLRVQSNTKNEGRFLSIKNEDFENIYNLIGNIDILMTDYSSIYFDYIATKKDVILTPFDLDDYIQNSRGHYFDYNELEGVKAYNWEDVCDIIKNKKYSSVSSSTIKKFSEYITGNSAEKLYNFIINEE